MEGGNGGKKEDKGEFLMTVGLSASHHRVQSVYPSSSVRVRGEQRRSHHSEPPPSFLSSPSLPPLYSSEAPRFEIKKWNAVTMWSWDICADTCAICRNNLNEPSIEYQVRPPPLPPSLLPSLDYSTLVPAGISLSRSCSSPPPPPTPTRPPRARECYPSFGCCLPFPSLHSSLHSSLPSSIPLG